MGDLQAVKSLQISRRTREAERLTSERASCGLLVFLKVLRLNLSLTDFSALAMAFVAQVNNETIKIHKPADGKERQGFHVKAPRMNLA